MGGVCACTRACTGVYTGKRVPHVHKAHACMCAHARACAVKADQGQRGHVIKGEKSLGGGAWADAGRRIFIRE